MSTKFKIFFFIISFSTTLTAQINLVPNHSFEIIDTCPALGYSPSHFAKYWYDVRNTPDYFNTCDASGGSYNIPKNTYGYQCAANGNAYLGLLITSPSWFNTGSQEVAGCKLIDSVVKNTKYFFSCKVSLSGGTGVGYAVKKLGCKLSTKKLPKIFPNTSSMDYIVNNYATFFNNSNYLTDTLNWIIIRGSFIADSNYKFFNIGAFHSYQNLDTVNSLNNGGQSSYYYLDDICLSKDSNTCNIGNQTTCFLTNINEFSFESKLSLAPNPSNDFISIIGIDEITPFKIFNGLGQLIKSGDTKPNENISIIDLAPAIYYIELKNKTWTKNIKLIVDR